MCINHTTRIKCSQRSSSRICRFRVNSISCQRIMSMCKIRIQKISNFILTSCQTITDLSWRHSIITRSKTFWENQLEIHTMSQRSAQLFKLCHGVSQRFQLRSEDKTFTHTSTLIFLSSSLLNHQTQSSIKWFQIPIREESRSFWSSLSIRWHLSILGDVIYCKGKI